MRKRTILTTCILPILLLSASFASQPAPTIAQSKYEVNFMEGMIAHHEMAIQMANICLQKAVHSELRTLCQNIIVTQQQEQQQMRSWLSDWYGISYQAQMTKGDQQMMQRMRSMNGPDFEVTFMKMMIRHHWSAVIEASSCVERAYHDELVALCTRIVEAQATEIRQMREWLCEWYGICNYGPKGNQRWEG
jgi:uncharacterized protein (DUF305 family)